MLIIVTPLDGGEREVSAVTRVEDVEEFSRSARRRVRLFDGDNDLGTVDLNQARIEVLPTP